MMTILKRALLLLLCVLLPMATLAEAAENRLEMAFGLFSVALPKAWASSEATADYLYDTRYDVDGLAWPMGVSYAPLDQYESTALPALNSRISMLFAFSGGEYTETRIAEETLPNGVTLRWQLMQGSTMHTLWFEAFTENFGYNMTLSGAPTAEADAVLLAIMRSFRADATIEQDILHLQQTQLPGGAFISVEHGLQLQLDEGWNIVTDPYLLLDNTAFILEKEDYRWMIQLLRTNQWTGDARGLLDAYLQMRGGTDLPGEVETITLENLGVEACTVVEQSGVYMRHIAFIHEGVGYYGSFMWITPDDAVARPWMDAAIQSLTQPE